MQPIHDDAQTGPVADDRAAGASAPPRRSPPSTLLKVAFRPYRPTDRNDFAGRREIAVLVAVSVGLGAWALFPTNVESGLYVPILPDGSNQAVNRQDSHMRGAGKAAVAATATSPAALVSPETMTKSTYAPAVRYLSSVADIGPIPLRAKLQALLILLHDRFGDQDPGALEDKVRALLALPDAVLTRLVEHRELADLDTTLDAALLGGSDLSKVTTDLGKIEVTSSPGPAERVDVVKVSGSPIFIVHTPTDRARQGVVDPRVAVAPPPSDVAEVSSMAVVEAVPNVAMRTFVAEPTAETSFAPMALASLPAPEPASTPAPVPETAPPPPPPAPAPPSSAVVEPPSSVVPSVAEPAPVVASTPTAPSTPTASATSTFTAQTASPSAQPSTAAQTSNEVMSSGNKFEPGQTASSATGSSSAPSSSTTTTHVEEPATGGATAGAGSTTPGGTTAGQGSAGTGGGSASSPSNNEGGAGGSGSGGSGSGGSGSSG